MSNVYDDAHKLVKSIKESDEYKEFMEIDKVIKSDKDLYKTIKEFQNYQLELQTMQMMGQPLDENKMTTAQSILDDLNENPLALDYFKKEMALNQMFADISKIIGDAMAFLNQ